MKRELLKETSQNGRYGVAIVGEEGISFPAEGKLVSLGSIAGHDTFEFLPDNGGQWIVIGSDLEPIVGCAAVLNMGLQGAKSVTILVCGEFSAYKDHGYSRRGHEVICRSRGKRIDVPASVLAAMGILPCEREEVRVEIPALDSPLAAALKAAGIA
jgi:hypothetical protein